MPRAHFVNSYKPPSLGSSRYSHNAHYCHALQITSLYLLIRTLHEQVESCFCSFASAGLVCLSAVVAAREHKLVLTSA